MLTDASSCGLRPGTYKVVEHVWKACYPGWEACAAWSEFYLSDEGQIRFTSEDKIVRFCHLSTDLAIWYEKMLQEGSLVYVT